ncbi:hypothetical protein ACE0DR_24865 [Azotobacter sp. CWF10]
MASARPLLPGRCWLIADRLEQPEIGERWLRLARHLARQQPAITLLLADDTPWEVQLLATDCVSRLPHVEGLDARQALELCGTTLALSLDASSPDATPLPIPCRSRNAIGCRCSPPKPPDSTGSAPSGCTNSVPTCQKKVRPDP